jgi:hypothetical protein
VELDKKLVYIAGPIANATDFVARFTAARAEVAALGYTPVCPIELNGVDQHTRQEDPVSRRDYLRRDIAALVNCDGIYLLDGWWDSKGARLEKLIADGLGLLVLYQDKVDELAAGYGAGPRTFERIHNKGDGDERGESGTDSCDSAGGS